MKKQMKQTKNINIIFDKKNIRSYNISIATLEMLSNLLLLENLVSFDFPFSWLSAEGKVKADIIPVACPTCKNKRLFDIDLHTEGNIQIKCPKCRSIVRVKMHRQEIHTEQIGI